MVQWEAAHGGLRYEGSFLCHILLEIALADEI